MECGGVDIFIFGTANSPLDMLCGCIRPPKGLEFTNPELLFWISLSFTSRLAVALPDAIVARLAAAAAVESDLQIDIY